MPTFSNILVPVDFSELSKQAFRFGLIMARPENATVHLMHDIEIPTETITGATIIREEMDAAYAESERELNELQRLPEAEGVAVHPDILRSTDPKRSILAYAEEHEIDLVVFGTHGRTSPVEKVIGSTAERVLRRSPCPTVTVRGGDVTERIELILVPVDLSKYPAQTIEHAADIARTHGARLLLMNVGSKNPADGVEETLRGLYAEAGGTPDDAGYFVSSDADDETIVDVAREHGADLILMVTQGRTGLRRALARSVAEGVVRKAPCPVMTYRTALEE